MLDREWRVHIGYIGRALLTEERKRWDTVYESSKSSESVGIGFAEVTRSGAMGTEWTMACVVSIRCVMGVG